MERCILLSARRYEFKDDKGKDVAGVTLTYLTDDVQTEGDTRGCQPLNVAAGLDVWHQLGTLPGLYDLDFKQRPGPKGKPTLTLVKLIQRGPIDMSFDDAA